jgi:hypothetical protein
VRACWYVPAVPEVKASGEPDFDPGKGLPALYNPLPRDHHPEGTSFACRSWSVAREGGGLVSGPEANDYGTEARAYPGCTHV